MNHGEVGPDAGRTAEIATRAARHAAAALMLAGAVAATKAAEAQVVPFLPPSPVPQGSPIPRVLPPAPPSVAPGTVIPPPTAPGGEVPNRPVRVTSVEVEGVSTRERAAMGESTEPPERSVDEEGTGEP